MMRPLRIAGEDGVEITYACIHWREFPSPFAEANVHELRAKGFLSPTELQSHQVWERVCGLLAMNEDKCLKCTHCRRLVLEPHQVPKLVRLDNEKEWTPAVDITTMEQTGRYRLRKGVSPKAPRLPVTKKPQSI